MKTRTTLLRVALAAATFVASAAVLAAAPSPENGVGTAAAAAAAAGSGSTVAPGVRIAVVDHKYNTIRYAYVKPQSEFVGTSAGADESAKQKPSWYKFGHP